LAVNIWTFLCPLPFTQVTESLEGSVVMRRLRVRPLIPDVAARRDETAGDGPVYVLGHSMGGVVGLTLAADVLPERVAGVVGVGIKVAWPPEDVARAAAAAARPSPVFGTREEAANRFLKMSGLAGLVAPDSGVVEAGVVQDGDEWRLTQDPAGFAVGVPDMRDLLDRVQCPFLLARGEHDAMVSDEDNAALTANTLRLDGLGHNAHIEDPARVLALLDRVVGRSNV
jgi:pimeloyl-ACP methyl ester carboxylesterase